MPEWVFIVHASSPDADPALVTKEAYEEVHKPNGWRLAPKSAIPEAVEIPGDTSPPSPVSKPPATKKRR